MNNEIISREECITMETAELAKKVGFDVEICKCGGFPECICDEETKRRVPQSMLQRWFREKHSLHITIYSASQESWMYRITKPSQKIKDGIYAEDFDDYEEALEDALQMCCSLI